MILNRFTSQFWETCKNELFIVFYNYVCVGEVLLSIKIKYIVRTLSFWREFIISTMINKIFMDKCGEKATK